METRSEFLGTMLRKLEGIEKSLEKQFYYLESEDLRYKPDPKSWDIVEIFEHLNLVNGYYVKVIGRAMDKAPIAKNENFKISWMGKKMVKSMEPKNGKRPFKMKTFKKTDPIALQQERGSKLIDHIVFQDFMEDMKQFKKLLQGNGEKDIQAVKIKSFIPIIKLKGGDAIAFVIAHMERHLLQAENLLDKRSQN